MDPLTNYQKLTHNKPNLHCQIEPISMLQLDKIIKEMKPGSSTSADMISMRTIKKLFVTLKYPLLNLINTTITTSEYPQNLKKSKIVPLLKKGKPSNEIKSFRGINILPSLSKIIDKTIYHQMLNFLVKNKLIPHEHHGGIQGNTTITAITTMLDKWANALEENKDLAIIILDQTAAYDLIYHPILLDKLRILGMSESTIELFKSYLSNRSQQVLVDATFSSELFCGPTSVIQGSVLSCLLFLVYTLDLPLIFLQTSLAIEDYDKDNKPKPNTFVDDVVVEIQLEEDNTNQSKIDNTMDKLETYMQANKLQLNRDKTQLLVISSRQHPKQSLNLKALPENVLPSRGFTYLGVDIDETLKWNYFLEDSKNNLISQLKKRLTALRMMKKFANFDLMKKYANGIFLSKLMYGAELWGGAPQYLKKKISTLLLEAARICVGVRVCNRVSATKLLKEMNWLNLEQILTISSNRLTHSIIHLKRPTLMAQRMKPKWVPGDQETRLSGPHKLGPRPRNVGRTRLTKYHYRAQAYHYWDLIPDEVKKITQKPLFKKWSKRTLKNKKDLPPPPPPPRRMKMK